MMENAKKITIFTIGHSNHETDWFVDLLERCSIECVVDVRSVPYSRWRPQFNKKEIAPLLNGRGMDYVFLGNELGGRVENPKYYSKGRIVYEKILSDDNMSSPFRSGIWKVTELSRRKRIVLMCAEKDPLQCHRALLIARELVGPRDDGHDREVRHILANGQSEDHAFTVKRLCGDSRIRKEYEKTRQGDLLSDSAAFENEMSSLEDFAYRMRGHEVAYHDEMQARDAERKPEEAR